jgi:hypothetical protein
MKRNLIAIAICTLGLATAAVAEPSLNVEGNEIVKLNAPEATSYQADTAAFAGRSMANEVTSYTHP